VDCKKPVNDAGDTVLTLSISQTPRAAERIVKLANTVERANREGVTALHLCGMRVCVCMCVHVCVRACVSYPFSLLGVLAFASF
jgi:hypothetical protein